MRYLTVLILLCLSLAARAQAPDFGAYHALVVGIDDYAHLRPLATAVGDARAVEALLRKRYGFETTLLENPDRAALMRALDLFRAELGPRDNLLIYYAGHGYLDKVTEEGFWLPADAEEDSQVEWIAISAVTRLLCATVAKHVLVIADSCYSGTLTRDSGARLPTGGERQAELARLSDKRARKALTSGGVEPVGDGHSVFAWVLLDTLAENDRILEGYALYRQLRWRVVVNAQQTSQSADVRFVGDEGGDFLFVPATFSRRAGTPEAGFLAGGEIRARLVGNTVRFRSISNGRTMRMHFLEDGALQVQREDRPGRFVVGKWWIKGRRVLCRNHERNPRTVCQRLMAGKTCEILRIYKGRDGTHLLDATVMPGRALLE